MQLNNINSSAEKMKNLIKTILILLSLQYILANQANAELIAGQTAFDKGDYITAYNQWITIAEQGIAQAQRKIGELYLNGHGVNLNYKRAVFWLEKSADQGDQFALTKLGEMYLTGNGINQNYKIAYELFVLAANQQNPIAQFQLGLMLESGLGVQKNLTEALKSYTASLKNGHDPAYERLKAILHDITLNNGLAVKRPMNSRSLLAKSTSRSTALAVPIPEVKSQILPLTTNKK